MKNEKVAKGRIIGLAGPCQEQWPSFLSQTDNETTQDEWVGATKNELPIDRSLTDFKDVTLMTAIYSISVNSLKF